MLRAIIHGNIVALNGYYYCLLQAQASSLKIDGNMIFSPSTLFLWLHMATYPLSCFNFHKWYGSECLVKVKQVGIKVCIICAKYFYFNRIEYKDSKYIKCDFIVAPVVNILGKQFAYKIYNSITSYNSSMVLFICDGFFFFRTTKQSSHSFVEFFIIEILFIINILIMSTMDPPNCARALNQIALLSINMLSACRYKQKDVFLQDHHRNCTLEANNNQYSIKPVNCA